MAEVEPAAVVRQPRDADAQVRRGVCEIQISEARSTMPGGEKRAIERPGEQSLADRD